MFDKYFDTYFGFVEIFLKIIGYLKKKNWLLKKYFYKLLFRSEILPMHWSLWKFRTSLEATLV